MKIDLSSFRNALASLQRAIVRAQADVTDEEVRDGVIQRFEYCYEMSWKMLKRQLEQEVANPAEVDRWSFRELLREGAERGIIDEVQRWMRYREKRNQTSHVYDEQVAEDVYQTAIEFYGDAVKLLSELEKR